MANRNWRSSGYQNFNQILTPMSYYQQPLPYNTERKTYGGSGARGGGGGYREDNYKNRDRKDFPSNRRDRLSPIKARRSPLPSLPRAHDNTAFRKSEINNNNRKPHNRYEVKAPRHTFDIKELSSTTVKLRYPKLYNYNNTPADFFHSRLNVQEAFPLYRPMKLGNHCEFQILNKEVERQILIDGDEQSVSVENLWEPEDANSRFSAKVMLLTTPHMKDLYKLVCLPNNNAEDNNNNKEGLLRNIQFLVGSKGKNEPMAFGGAWSPSLDGSDPEDDPYVLINTAIRTCKALTGIDLAGCKTWYKFLDIHYYRNEEVAEGDSGEPKVEVVTIFIPDIWSCTPTENEWKELREKYEQKLHQLLNPNKSESPAEETAANNDDEAVKDEVENKMEVSTTEEKVDEKVADEAKVEEETAELDLNLLKVTELRAKLTERGLEPKGLKLQLIQRLQEAIDNDKKKAAEVKADETVKTNEKAAVEAEPKKEIVAIVKVAVENQIPEKERQKLEKIYKINEKPSILVQANKEFNNGKFECTFVSLESLLEYRGEETQKEHAFEVALFAEQFNEMIQRDAAFSIYKSLTRLPEIVKESSAATVESSEPKKARLELHQQQPKSKVMADVDLLFSFCVFDCDNSGSIRDYDLESILHSIGLNLSRSQVKKLMAKIPSKKGNLQYRDVVEREVVEGGEEDVTTLRAKKTADIDSLIELAQGNKSFFDEADTEHLSKREGPLQLLDKLNCVELKKNNTELQLYLLKEELKKLKSSCAGSDEVELHLRENIKKIGEKLSVEKEVLEKLSEKGKVYGGLLEAARANMAVSIDSINGQFELEKQLAEAKKRQQEEEEAAAKAAKEEAEALEAEEKKKMEVEESAVTTAVTAVSEIKVDDTKAPALALL